MDMAGDTLLGFRISHRRGHIRDREQHSWGFQAVQKELPSMRDLYVVESTSNLRATP
jgi:hypothetical protein